MPQIWVTHAELIRFSSLVTAEVETRMHALKWPRRSCSDGQVRIKLPDDMVFPFMAEAVRSKGESRFASIGQSPGPEGRIAAA